MISHCDPAELPESSTEDKSEDHFLEAYCPTCAHVVDACCPKCRTHVEPAGASISYPTRVGPDADALLSPDTQYPTKLYTMEQVQAMATALANRVIDNIIDDRNAKFTAGCFRIASGHAYAEGLTMKALAKEWGVGRATVSKKCVALCKVFGIRPSRYMRDELTKDNYRHANRRPQKIP